MANIAWQKPATDALTVLGIVLSVLVVGMRALSDFFIDGGSVLVTHYAVSLLGVLVAVSLFVVSRIAVKFTNNSRKAMMCFGFSMVGLVLVTHRVDADASRCKISEAWVGFATRTMNCDPAATSQWRNIGYFSAAICSAAQCLAVPMGIWPWRLEILQVD